MEELNNCKKRHIVRTLCALSIVQVNLKKHRNCYEDERKRCKKEKEECVFNSYILGQLTRSFTEAQAMVQKLLKDFENVEFKERNKDTASIINGIYEVLNRDKEHLKSYKEECKSPSLPAGFVDSWLTSYYSFKYLLKNYMQTLVRCNLDVEKLKRSMDKYHDFFIKEIV